MVAYNPFIPDWAQPKGTFAGKPFNRRPRGKNIPKEYSPSTLEAFIDDMDFTNEISYKLKKLGNVRIDIAGKIKSEIVEDFKSALVVQLTSGDGSNITPLEAYERADIPEEEFAQVPGAAELQINLNPWDWFSDPKKQAQILVEGIKGSVFNRTDFGLRAEAKIMKDYLSGEDPEMKVLGFIPIKVSNVLNQDLCDYTLGAMDPFAPRQPGSPTIHGLIGKVFKKERIVKAGTISDAPETPTAMGTASTTLSVNHGRKEAFRVKDVYREFVNSVGDAYEGVASSRTRPTSVAAAFLSGINAVKDTINVAKEKDVLSDALSAAADLFELQAQMVNAFSSVSGTIIKTKGLLSNYLSDSRPNAGIKLKETLTFLLGKADENGILQPGSIDKAIAALKKAEGTVPPDKYKKALESLQKSKKLAERLQEVVTKGKIDLTLAGDLNLLSQSLSGRPPFGLFSKSIAQELMEEVLEGPLFRPENLSQVTNNPVLSTLVQVKATLNRLGVISDNQAFGDAATLILDKSEKFIDQAITNPITAYIKVFTPAIYVTRLLEDVHYFGFRYVKPTEGVARSKLGLWIEKHLIGEYKFTLKMGLNLPSISTDIIVRKVTVTGGKEIGEVLNFYKSFRQFSTDPAGDVPKEVLRNLVANDLNMKDALNYRDLLKYLNTDPSLLAGKFLLVGDTFLEGEDLVKHLLKVRATIFKYKDQLGLKFDAAENLINDAENLEILTKFFTSLNARAANGNLPNITSQFLGYGQRFVAHLSEIQAKLMAHPVLGKVFGVANYKNLVAKAISTALTQLLTAAFASVTGGVGALLEAIVPFLDRVTQFVVYHILNKIEKFFTDLIGITMKRLANFDAGFIADGIAYVVESNLKTIFRVVIAFSVCFFILAGTIVFIVAAFLSAFSTIDLATFNEIAPNSSVARPLNPEIVVGCFKFVDGSGTSKALYPNAPREYIWELGAWPAPLQGRIENSINRLIQKHPNYVQKICSRPPIELYYSPYPQIFSAYSSYGNIYFSNHAILRSNGQEHMDWLLTHETGHVLDAVEGAGAPYTAAFSAIHNSPELPIPTYPAFSRVYCGSGVNNARKLPMNEDFAESIAQFSVNYNACGNAAINYALIRPRRYNFVKNTIFQE